MNGKPLWYFWLPGLLVAAGVVASFAVAQEQIKQHDRRITGIEQALKEVGELRGDQKVLKKTIELQAKSTNDRLDRMVREQERQFKLIIDKLDGR